MKQKSFILTSVFFVVFMGCFITSNIIIKENRNNMGTSYTLQIPAIPARAIKFITGEFNGLMSDFLLLQISSFLGSNQKISNQEWQKINLGYQQILTLDPYFQQALMQIQGIMAWNRDMTPAAIDLLKISEKNRPWDWMPGYYIGFDYYYFLQDFEKASEIFLKTAAIKKAPLLIALLGSRFAVQGQRVETSLLSLKYMVEDPELSEDSKKEIQDRIVLLKGILILEKAVEQYNTLYAKLPESLNDLIRENIIPALPEHPEFMPYRYNNQTGKIKY